MFECPLQLPTVDGLEFLGVDVVKRCLDNDSGQLRFELASVATESLLDVSSHLFGHVFGHVPVCVPDDQKRTSEAPAGVDDAFWTGMALYCKVTDDHPITGGIPVGVAEMVDDETNTVLVSSLGYTTYVSEGHDTDAADEVLANAVVYTTEGEPGNPEIVSADIDPISVGETPSVDGQHENSADDRWPILEIQ